MELWRDPPWAETLATAGDKVDTGHSLRVLVE